MVILIKNGNSSCLGMVLQIPECQKNCSFTLGNLPLLVVSCSTSMCAAAAAGRLVSGQRRSAVPMHFDLLDVVPFEVPQEIPL